MAAGDLLFNHKTTKDQFALNMQDVFNNKKILYHSNFQNVL